MSSDQNPNQKFDTNKEHLPRQSKSKILTFSIRRLDGRNDVLDVNELLLIIFPGTPHLKPHEAAPLRLCVLEMTTATKWTETRHKTKFCTRNERVVQYTRIESSRL